MKGGSSFYKISYTYSARGNGELKEEEEEEEEEEEKHTQLARECPRSKHCALCGLRKCPRFSTHKARSAGCYISIIWTVSDTGAFLNNPPGILCRVVLGSKRAPTSRKCEPG